METENATKLDERAAAADSQPAVNWSPLVTKGSRMLARVQRILYWAEVIRARRATAQRIIALGLAVFTVIAFLRPNQYEGTARLMPPNPGADIGSLLQMASGDSGGALTGGIGGGGIASQLLGVTTPGQLFIAVLGSRTVSDHIIDRFNLMAEYHTSKIEDCRNELDDRTDFDEDKKSGVIRITVTDESPRRAATIARAYVQELDKLMADVSTSSARRERVFLDQRLRVAEHDLQRTETEFTEFAAQNSALEIPEQAKAMVEALGALEGNLVAARVELQSLRQTYTDKDFRVQQAQARVAQLEQELSKMSGTEHAQNSGTLFDHLSFNKLPRLGKTYIDHYRRMKLQETVFELLTKQHELARIAEAREVPSIQVLDEPVVPTKKSSPKRGLFILIGLVLSAGFAVAVIIVDEVWMRIDAGNADKENLQVFLARLREAFLSFTSRTYRSARRRNETHWTKEL